MIQLFKNLFKKESLNTEGLHYISFWTAGLNFESRGANVLKCKMHEKVYLHREPEHATDPNAIHVRTRKGASLGYVGKYRAMKLAPLLDTQKVANVAYIVDMKSDFIQQVYGVKVAVPMNDAVYRKFNMGIELSVLFEKSDCGNQYLLLECEEHRFDIVLEFLQSKKIAIRRKGVFYRPGNDGKLYSWYILLDENEDTDRLHKMLIMKFPVLIEKLDRELTEEYINIQDRELLSLHQQNAILANENTKLYKQVQRYAAAHKKYNHDFDNMVHLTLENVVFLRDSLDVLKNEMKDYTYPLKKILQIQSESNLEAKAVDSLNDWFVTACNSGQKEEGCMYFKKEKNDLKLLISFKRDEKADERYLLQI